MYMKAAILFYFALTFSLAAADEARVIPEGKINAGRTLFVEKGCYKCHTAGDTTLPQSDLSQELFIELGVKKHEGWSRDTFAKSILNPNHTVSEKYRKVMITQDDKLKAENSPMPGFNDILSVSDLIHLTTFLDSLN